MPTTMNKNVLHTLSLLLVFTFTGAAMEQDDVRMLSVTR